MRHADTDTLLRLNDKAKLANLNQWLMVRFFEDVDPTGRHVLAVAFPHGEQPGPKRIAGQPPHFRTLWYAEMRDGSTRRVLLDVQPDDLAGLPEIAGTRSDAAFAGVEVSDLPAVVTLDDGYVVDGRHLVESARSQGELAIRVVELHGLSDQEVVRIRDLIEEE